LLSIKVLAIFYEESSDAMGRLLEELAIHICQNLDDHAYAAIDRKSVRTLRLHDFDTGARLGDRKDLEGLE